LPLRPPLAVGEGCTGRRLRLDAEKGTAGRGSFQAQVRQPIQRSPANSAVHCPSASGGS